MAEFHGQITVNGVVGQHVFLEAETEADALVAVKRHAVAVVRNPAPGAIARVAVAVAGV